MAKRHLSIDDGNGKITVLPVGAVAAMRSDHLLPGISSMWHTGGICCDPWITTNVASLLTSLILAFPIARPCHLTGFGVRVTTGPAGASEVKIALWRDNGHGYPGVLVSPATCAITLPMGATGVKLLDLSGTPIALDPDLYWLGMQFKDAGILAAGVALLLSNMLGWPDIASTAFSGLVLNNPYADFPRDPYSISGGEVESAYAGGQSILPFARISYP